MFWFDIGKNKGTKIIYYMEDNYMLLKEQGGDIGKPLSGLSFFREKKFDGKRLYYPVYNDSFVILAIAISDKKAPYNLTLTLYQFAYFLLFFLFNNFINTFFRNFYILLINIITNKSAIYH